MKYTAYILALSLVSSVASAQEQPTANVTPFDIDPVIEVPITMGVFIASGLPRLFVDDLVDAPACGLDCDPASVNSFDRGVIGWHSETSRKISDAAFLTSLALPHALGALDMLVSDNGDGWDGFGVDTFVLVETLLWTLAVNNAFDMAVQRPRPLVYDQGVDAETRTDPNSALSFFSGHTSASFAMATAYSRLFMQRHPNSDAVVPVWIGTHALAATAGIARVRAGEHFWSDVIVGAAFGSAMGVAVPWLHETSDKLNEGGPNIRIAPSVTRSGATLTLSYTPL